MDGSVTRPASFAEEFAQDWAAWVFEYALPPLPEIVRVEEWVPVAYWLSESWAAMHYVGGPGADPDVTDEPSLFTETEGYRRRGDTWEPACCGSGTDWAQGLELRRPELHARSAFGGESFCGCGDWAVGCMDGVAGVAATVVELEQAGHISTRPLDSPLGAWVVSFNGYEPAIVRLRDDHGEILYEQRFEPPVPRQ